MTCPILWLRAFFAACAPDVLVYLLQVAAVTAYSPSALVPATPIPGHRSRPSGRHVRSGSGSQWIFAASADTPQAKALQLEEEVRTTSPLIIIARPLVMLIMFVY